LARGTGALDIIMTIFYDMAHLMYIFFLFDTSSLLIFTN